MKENPAFILGTDVAEKIFTKGREKLDKKKMKEFSEKAIDTLFEIANSEDVPLPKRMEALKYFASMNNETETVTAGKTEIIFEVKK